LATKGLVTCTLFLGSLFAGLPLFSPNSTGTSVAGQESRAANAGDPARAVYLPPVPEIAPIDITKQRDDLPNTTGPNAPPAAPVAVPPAAPVVAKMPATAKAPAPANDAKPKPTASLHARVRQVVRENKTEETQRVGLGDVAYQDVPDDGSIMVGMAVTYAPFFNHNIIKSVRPIYQRPDGSRYDGPVCGTPTGIGERVEAKEGYAIGAAAIQAGMGIDGMQMTFMEIGPDGLNLHKSYLSKWLGLNGGANATTYVNDGRPIIGIAGMRSSNPSGPAFCMCLVTTKAGAISEADGDLQTVPTSHATQRDDLPSPITQYPQRTTPVAQTPAAPPVILQEPPMPPIPQPAYLFPPRVRQQSLETQMQNMATPMQNMQMAQQSQQRVRQQMMQRQQQILQQHQLGLHH
jgi:hypothetical protein